MGTYRQDERKGESTHEPSTERNERHKNGTGDARRAEGRTHHTHAEDDTTNEEQYIERSTDDEDILLLQHVNGLVYPFVPGRRANGAQDTQERR